MSIVKERPGDDPRKAVDCFGDTETRRKCKKVVGGFAWPGKKPGFAVLVGEESDLNLKTDEKRHLWVMEEAQDFNIENLARRAFELLKIYHGESFYGDTTAEPLMRLLRPSGLLLKEAPYVSHERSFVFYRSVIEEYLAAKALHFGESSALRQFLMELSPEESSADAETFPAIAALGYAVSRLKLYPSLPPLPPVQQQKPHAMPTNDYDYLKKHGLLRERGGSF